MKIFTPSRLTTRLVISHLLVGMVSIGLITILAYSFILQSGRREIEDSLTDVALNTSNSLEAPFLSQRGNQNFISAIRQVMVKVISDENMIEYVVFARDGSILSSSDAPPSLDRLDQMKPQINNTLRGRTTQYSSLDPQQGDVFFTIVPISHLDVVYGALMLTNPYEPNLQDTRRSLITMLIISWLILIAVGLGANLVAQTFNRPIRNLTRMAERMSAGDFLARAELSGPEELRQLAASLNTMAAQLQDNLDGMRAFVANASHELRTPLTAMRLNTDALLNGACDDAAVSQRFLSQLEYEIDLMSRTVNDLLDLSRIEANRNMPPQGEINLADLVSETTQLWHNRALQADLALRVNGPSHPVMILGNEDQLHRLLNNLLDNAFKNTPAGGWIEVNLYQISDKLIRLEVCDNGRGIAPEHLPRLFERFYRTETPDPQAKISGTGLGLAIVKSIVESHQAKIGVSSTVGKGSTFWIEFKPTNYKKPGKRN